MIFAFGCSQPQKKEITNGSVNENKFFNGYPDELAETMKYIDKLGGPDTYEHFPTPLNLVNNGSG